MYPNGVEMDAFFKALVEAVLGAGVHGYIAILVLSVVALGWFVFKRESETKVERRDLIDQFQRTIESDRKDLLQVIDKYQEGQISVIQAINEIKVLIATIGGKL
jgi:uncharacterized membrane protein